MSGAKGSVGEWLKGRARADLGALRLDQLMLSGGITVGPGVESWHSCTCVW